MSDRDLRAARATYAALRELVSEKKGGWDDAASRTRFARLCADGLRLLNDAEFRERLRAIAAQAASLYSRDGHLGQARGRMSGAECLRLEMLIGLETLNTRLFVLAALRERAGTFPAATAHAPQACLAAAARRDQGVV